MNLSFYCLVSYDYKYLASSITSYYDIADEIILAIDKNRISWSNNVFTFDDNEFNDIIKDIDTDNKIKIVEENFHKSLNPIENHTDERNYISKLCKENNYIIAIDSDEIVLNAQEFLSWINQNKPTQDINAYFYTVFKAFESKLIITEPFEVESVGTLSRGEYRKFRTTSKAKIQSPLRILNYSFGRSHEDTITKVKNWHYSQLFKFQEFMDFWRNINLKSYKEHSYFHPLKINNVWKNMRLVELSKFITDDKILSKMGFKNEKASIIIPIKNQFKIVQLCLNSINKYYSKHNICLVDDGSTEPETIKLLQDFAKTNKDWTLIRHDKSLGHTKACEAGIENTIYENMFLLNSDTIVTKNSFNIMIKTMNSIPNIAVVGCTTSSATGVQLNQTANVNRFKWSTEEIEKFADEIEKEKGIEDIELVNGFCFGIKRSIFTTVGGFDKNLNCYGNEKELLIRIRNAGYRTVWIKGCYLHHFGKMSYLQEKNINIGQACLDADRYIRRKHGKLS